jgi:hypothetical protein
MGPHDVVDDTQTEAAAAALARQALVHLVKRTEDALLIPALDADAIVLDFEDEPLRLLPDPESNPLVVT